MLGWVEGYPATSAGRNCRRGDALVALLVLCAACFEVVENELAERNIEKSFAIVSDGETYHLNDARGAIAGSPNGSHPRPRPHHAPRPPSHVPPSTDLENVARLAHPHAITRFLHRPPGSNISKRTMTRSSRTHAGHNARLLAH